ncbi:MAG: NifB/NifX family molybdenum-iron cluster-binding protein [Fervidicoccaceae archaeon]
MRIAAPVARSGNALLLHPHFGRAPYFAFVEVVNDKISSVEVVENMYRSHERGKARGLLNVIMERNPDCVLALGMGEGAFEMLRSSGIKIYFYPSSSGAMPPLEKAVDSLIRGELKEAEEPRELDEEH